MCKGGGWGVGGGSTSIMWVMCPLRPPPKTSLRHLARPKVSALTFPGIIVTRGLDLVALFQLEGDTPFLNSHPLPQTFNVVASVLRVNFHRFLRFWLCKKKKFILFETKKTFIMLVRKKNNTVRWRLKFFAPI